MFKSFLFCSQQACKQKNSTLLEILTASENMKVQDLILKSNQSSYCQNIFWFDLVTVGGYMWYNSSGANVSYRNFGDFDTEEIYVQYSVGVLYLNPQNTMKWKIVLNSSHTSICSICQKGEISIKNTRCSCCCRCLPSESFASPWFIICQTSKPLGNKDACVH